MARGRSEAGKRKGEKMEKIMRLAKKRFSKDGLEILWDFFLSEEETGWTAPYKEFKKLFAEFGPEAEDEVAGALGLADDDGIEDYGHYLQDGGFILDLRTIQL
jgi:hypothetical protein